MPERRQTYFLFQGLLTSVLLLMFAVQRSSIPSWGPRITLLGGALLASLVAIRLLPARILSSWLFQVALFMIDAVLASSTLAWTRPQSDLYFIYVLIIFGTALMREFWQSLLVALVCSLLYLASAWSAARGFPADEAFWLRFSFLWVITPFLAILSRDAAQAQRDHEEKYQGRLVQAERLATLGQLAGEVAHRIKGPLTTILVDAEVLAYKLRSKEAHKELQQIQEEVARCKQILKNLLDLGRIEEFDVVSVDLRKPIQAALKSIQPQADKLGISIRVDGLDRALPVKGDPSLLHEAIAAVLQNAVEACRKGGRIGVKAAVVEATPWWHVLKDKTYSAVLTIEDDGRGIEPKDLSRILQPFFTTKGKEGTGLGLSAAFRILQKHGGTIEPHSEGPGLGARFTLTLPSSARGRAKA